jgi:hypothetical protein
MALRRLWVLGTIGVTAMAYAVAFLLAPALGSNPGPLLAGVLFIASSVHVASSGWFASLPEVRHEAASHRGRYLWAPITLVVVTAAVAASVSPSTFRALLLGFFTWQFFHFQKQNLGIAALAGTSGGDGSLTAPERRALVAAAIAGIVALAARPDLLDVAVDVPWRGLFAVATVGYGCAVVLGAVTFSRRPRDRRHAPITILYGAGLLFFVPVFLFESPYAAVAGLTIAHGLQYLLLVGLVAWGGPPGADRATSLAVLVNVAVLGGAVLAALSHLHDDGPGLQALYGAYLGVVMAHFVVDAGLWRLRDAFPQAFLLARVPYLLRPD